MGKKSKLTEDMKHCYICGSSVVQIHHVFGGTANRKISDALGYVVPLCPMHHTGCKGVHANRELDLKIKRDAQRVFEQKDGTRKDFRKLFGKSWL